MLGRRPPLWPHGYPIATPVTSVTARALVASVLGVMNGVAVAMLAKRHRGWMHGGSRPEDARRAGSARVFSVRTGTHVVYKQLRGQHFPKGHS